MPIGPKTKPEFYRRFEKHEFGNMGENWPTLGACLNSGYNKLLAIRTKIPGGRFDFDIPANEITDRYIDFIRSGYKDEELQFSAMMPDDKIVIQGEIARTSHGLYLRYTKVKKAMRQALKEENLIATGMLANEMLKTYCDPTSYEWINYLLDNYEFTHESSSIVEFSVYSIPLGVYNNNTVIWEVRNY